MHQIPSKVLMHFCFMCNAVVILQRNFHHIKTYLLNKMQTANYRLSVFYGEPPYPIREDSLFNYKTYYTRA